MCFALVLLFTAIGISLNLQKVAMAATEQTYFSAEKYTDSDNLLLPNGNLSNKTIIKFAEEVNAGYFGQEFPELAQVVPLEYLESTENTATFAYNGKEYGFYMAKDGDHFDLLLIDFVYEFDDADHTNNEYKIRIKPILQTGFSRSSTEDGYVWEKTDPTYTYYVANPRFLSVVQNENALNYGDAGYSRAHLCRLTKRCFGKTPYQLMHAARMRIIRESLLTTDKTLETIADEVGYASLSQFYAAVKNHFGISPGEIRRKNKYPL